MGIRLLRPFLHSLCCNSPWNYAVFWKFEHRQEMILAWEDGFCDILKLGDQVPRTVEGFHLENKSTMHSPTFASDVLGGASFEYPVKLAVAEMSNASHVLGKGIVGKAASTGIAHWVYLDNIVTDLFDSVLEHEYPDEWLHQIAAGIKTILLLPVHPYGVLQLGSMQMVAEDEALVADVRDKFESLKEPDGHEWRYPIQEFSVMTSFNDNYEEPSTITTENVISNQNTIHPFMIEDCSLIDDHMMPLFMAQDVCNTSGGQNVSENEFNQCPSSMIYAARPCQLSNEDYIYYTAEDDDEVLKYIHNEEKLRTFTYSENYDKRFSGEFVNELTDFLFEETPAESTFISNGSYSTVCGSGNNLLGFLRESDLYKALVTTADNPYQCTYGTSISSQDVVYCSNGDTEPSYSVNVSGVESDRIPKNEVNMEDLLEATVANACDSSDNNSGNKSIITSLSMFPEKHEQPSSKRRGESKHSASVAESKDIPWNFLMSGLADHEIRTPCKLTSSVSSVESKVGALSDKKRERKDSMNLRKVSRLSSTNKRRTHVGGSQKPRPRDRQLIQDRIKELREIVPNSGSCSIDGLLDKTIKHMLFLRSATKQADTLRHQDFEEVTDENTTEQAEIIHNHQCGASWAVELGNEQQLCPIVVKDLEQPGHMLIEMQCADHRRFLEIADAIHRLQLTILKGVLVKITDTSTARFIVETSGSFHRLDIFWPLMQLLQRSQLPVSSKV